MWEEGMSRLTMRRKWKRGIEGGRGRQERRGREEQREKGRGEILRRREAGT